MTEIRVPIGTMNTRITIPVEDEDVVYLDVNFVDQSSPNGYFGAVITCNNNYDFKYVENPGDYASVDGVICINNIQYNIVISKNQDERVYYVYFDIM